MNYYYIPWSTSNSLDSSISAFRFDSSSTSKSNGLHLVRKGGAAVGSVFGRSRAFRATVASSSRLDSQIYYTSIRMPTIGVKGGRMFEESSNLKPAIHSSHLDPRMATMTYDNNSFFNRSLCKSDRTTIPLLFFTIGQSIFLLIVLLFF